MADAEDKLRHWQALASLPRDDVRRGELEAHIATMSAEERARWRQVLAETDALYVLLEQVEPPAGLEGRLLGIAAEEGKGRWYLGRDIAARRWPLYAASLVILAMLGAYVLMYGGDDTEPRALAGGKAQKLAALAVEDHAAAPALDVASGDVMVVEAKLKALKPGFPVLVLRPRVGLKLLGGGVCRRGVMEGVYTRWEGDGMVYTVYQLDGSGMSIPKRFARTEAEPKELWKEPYHYRVVMWPGSLGNCTWALVMERDKAVDAFSNSY